MSYVAGAEFSGSVVEIELFNTVLQDPDGMYVFVPNSKFWGVVFTNYSREPKRRLDFQVGISYDADIQLARRVLLEIAENDTRILSDPAPVFNVVDLGERAVKVQLRLWTKTPDHWDVRFDLTEATKLAFDKAAIDIPHLQLSTPTETTAALDAKVATTNG